MVVELLKDWLCGSFACNRNLLILVVEVLLLSCNHFGVFKMPAHVLLSALEDDHDARPVSPSPSATPSGKQAL